MFHSGKQKITLMVSAMVSTFLLTVGALPGVLSRTIQPADMALLNPTLPATPAALQKRE